MSLNGKYKHKLQILSVNVNKIYLNSIPNDLPESKDYLILYIKYRKYPLCEYYTISNLYIKNINYKLSYKPSNKMSLYVI
jgi:hypothetical protein